MEIYNTTHLRMLWEFALDGLKLQNIPLFTPASSGDFGVLNIKNDILEALYRVPQKEFYILFDCGAVPEGSNQRTKAISIDTFAMLNTNLTLDAQITLRGWGDAQASIPSINNMRNQATIIFNTTKRQLCGNDDYQRDLIYLEPNESMAIRKFRYFLLDVNDSTNQSNFLEVGRVLGGQSSILIDDVTDGSNTFTDTIDFEERSYTDKLDLNGFSSIANERALKRSLGVEFKNMSIFSQNYLILRKYWRYCRDTKKALVIPILDNPTGYHLFAKLDSLPKQKIKYVEKNHVYTDFNLTWDEAK